MGNSAGQRAGGHGERARSRGAKGVTLSGGGRPTWRRDRGSNRSVGALVRLGTARLRLRCVLLLLKGEKNEPGEEDDRSGPTMLAFPPSNI